MTPSVLLVDDDNELTRVLAEWLRQRGYRIEIASRAEPALDALERCAFDVVVTDLRMPGVSGIELCGRVAERCPGLPVIVMTGFGSLDAAIDAIRAGAYDFVEKPVKLDLLRIAIDRAATHAAARREIRRLREAGTGHAVVPGLVGESEAIRRVAAAIDGIAAADTTVLVAGETGTGKEVVAQAIHAASRRATRPFVALNCAAIPESLLESELFGHARGAFTDARAARGGLFERASGGTLFLDEIGDMPPSTQPKLLRVLQEKQYRPVGSDVEHRVDVRVIAATNIDIESAVEERRFREDLYYRLNVMRIDLPPLRARGNDVLLLATHFVARFAERLKKPVTRLATAVAERLLAYDWPGNVRELENCMERAVALAPFDEIRVEDLPEKVRAHRRDQVTLPASDPRELLPLAAIELRYVAQVYEAVGRNKTLAARVLGLDRKTLYRKLEQCGLLEPDGVRR